MADPTPTPDPAPPDLAALTAEAIDRCATLARATEEPGRITRRFLSEPMPAVHALVAGWMAEAGMTARVDAAGNIVGRLAPEGCPADAASLVIGSHLDTVPDAGAFDGVLGVLLGIAAVRAAGRPLPCPVAVVGFSEEEGVRYRTPFLGSRAFAGTFDPAWLDLRDDDGVSMAEAFRRFGLDPGRVGEAAWPRGRIGAFLEVHIEQGPVLEALDAPLGVVTGLVGQSRLLVAFQGRAGHAGTCPMDHRRDALAGACEWVLAAERLARATEGLRATVGTIAVEPGGTNVVPGLATLSLDLRHASDDAREAALNALIAEAGEISQRRGLSFRVDRVQHLPAVPTDLDLSDRLAECVAEAGLPVQRLPSGAGHDAAILAEVAPVALLFVRSPGGISHHPDESVRPGDVAAALGATVRFLDSWRPAPPIPTPEATP